MSHKEPAGVRKPLFGLVAVAVIFALMTWRSAEDASGRTGLSVAPTILPEGVEIDPPAPGARVDVRTNKYSFEPSTVDDATEVRIVNSANGDASAWRLHDPRSTLTQSVVGQFGDLICVEARNTSQNVSIAEIGFVPAPSDRSPVDFEERDITAALDQASGRFTVSAGPGSLVDQSFPVRIELLWGGTSSGSLLIGGNSQENTASWARAVGNTANPVSAGDRVILRATDNVGNVSELVFLASWTALTTGSIGELAASPTQAEAEIAGTAGMISLGDGSSQVTAFGREFIHTLELCKINAPIISLPVTLTYRSGIAQSVGSAEVYDGPVGLGFDWNLDARVVYSRSTDTYDWIPGDGRRVGPFTRSETTGGLQRYDSPKGVFLRLEEQTAPNGEIYLTQANGSRWVFNDRGYLIRMEDRFSYSGSAIDPILNRVTLTRNGDNQVVRAELGNGQIVVFGWFDHGRLASIRQGGRVVELSYDSSGALTKSQLAAGATYSLGYNQLNPGLLETIAEVDGAASVTIVDNEYVNSLSLFRLSTHRNRHNPAPHAATLFTTGTLSTIVTDPTGATREYEHGFVAPRELKAIQVNSVGADRTTGGYPGTESDPTHWRTEFAVNPQNYLRSEEKLITAGAQGETTTEWHRWVYESDSASEPRLRDRVKTHELVDPSSTASPPATKFQETWVYGSGEDYWPSSHTDFDGVATAYSYNDAGRVTWTKSAQVTLPSGAAGYRIENSRSYDANGRLVGEKTPDRVHSGSAHDSTVLSYHTTGVGYGYLAITREQGAVTGAAGPWVRYEYDAYGNAARVSRPNRTSVGEQTTSLTFDAQNRVIRSIGPSIQLTDPNLPAATVYSETQYSYGASQFRLVKEEARHWSEDGGVGIGGGTPGWVTTDFVYDSSGRLSQVLSDLSNDGSTLERSETLTEYTIRGRVSREKTLLGASTYAVTDRAYDASGQLLRVSRNPHDETQVSPNPIDTWFRYDGKGRVVQRFEEGAGTESFRTIYDAYGRLESTETPQAYLDAEQGATVGSFRTVTEYVDGTDRWGATGSRREFILAGAPTVISRETWAHDEAGRRTSDRVWFRTDSGGVDVYSVSATDLFPGGEIRKEYVPFEEGAPDYSSYDEVVQEAEFHRPATRQSVVAAVVVEKATMTYDLSTGWLVKAELVGWDETLVPEAGWGATYRTDFVHDEVGRVIRTEQYGSTAGRQRIRYTHFDGMGNVASSYNGNASGTATGTITKAQFDLAGRRVEERVGKSFESGDLFLTSRWSYDRAGRVLERQRVSNPGANEAIEAETTTYDGLGRPLVVSSVDNGTTTYFYGFNSNGSPFVEVETGDEVIRRTTRNQLGHTLLEEVVAPGSLTLSGVERIEYSYYGNSGCGCVASGNPSIVETYVAGSATPETTVTREYSPRGEITLESIEVDRPSLDPVLLTTVFEFDAASRKVGLTYPERTDSAAPTVVTYEYRNDGKVVSMFVDESGQGAEQVTAYRYEGRRTRELEQYAYADGVPKTLTARTESVYDSLGRIDSKSYTLGENMGFQQTFDTHVPATRPRDLDGRLTGIATAPRASTVTTQPVFEADYNGVGQLIRETYVIGPANSPIEVEREYDRDSSGLRSIDDSWSNVQVTQFVGCAEAIPTWEFTRPVTEIGNDIAIDGVIPAAWNAFDGQNLSASPDSHVPGFAYLERAWYHHRKSVSAGGWLESTTDHYLSLNDCDCSGGQDPSSPDWQSYYQIERRSTLDAWGREVEMTYEKTLLTEDYVPAHNPSEPQPAIVENSHTFACYGPAQAPVYTEVPSGASQLVTTFDPHVNIYDGYGRIVFTLRPMLADDPGTGVDYSLGLNLGLFHAYDGTLRIMSRGAELGEGQIGSGAEVHDTHLEVYRNPESGQADKMHFNRDSVWPGANPWNPWDTGITGMPTSTGSGFASPLYDLRGSRMLLNALPATGAQLEHPFATSSMAFSHSGERVVSPNEVVNTPFVLGCDLVDIFYQSWGPAPSGTDPKTSPPGEPKTISDECHSRCVWRGNISFKWKSLIALVGATWGSGGFKLSATDLSGNCTYQLDGEIDLPSQPAVGAAAGYSAANFRVDDEERNCEWPIAAGAWSKPLARARVSSLGVNVLEAADIGHYKYQVGQFNGTSISGSGAAGALTAGEDASTSQLGPNVATGARGCVIQRRMRKATPAGSIPEKIDTHSGSCNIPFL